MGHTHSNAIHYIERDDSFTISERRPGLFVKVGMNGELHWQLGGSCSGAPAGPDKCSARSWQIVQTFSGPVGYADWRPTLYGPPPRL